MSTHLNIIDIYNNVFNFIINDNIIKKISLYTNIPKDNIKFIEIFGTCIELFDGIFQDFFNLKTILLSNSNIYNIGAYCFNNCINLTHISLPNNISSINNSVFENC